MKPVELYLDRSDIFYQLALSQVDGVGTLSAKKLIQHFGSAKDAFAGKVRDLLQVPGMNSTRAASIFAFADFAKAEKQIAFCEKNGVDILSYQDKAYPNRLKHCEDGPLVLFKKGNANLCANRMVSIVGTRRITEHGKQITRDLVAGLVPFGVTVVSGLAYGVDIEAHKAALDVGLPTVAVLAHGLNRIYPTAHTKYAAAMVENGALLTEFTTESKPDRENFPMRNRIVAGMSDATIVIESGATGGSMITADLANGYSRDVFAIPGRIGDEHSIGCNRLIKSHRASLLESVKDLEYIMGWQREEKSRSVQKKIFVDLNPNEEKLIFILREKGKIQIDELCLLAGITMSSVMVHLLNLELNGLVRSFPGKMYEVC